MEPEFILKTIQRLILIGRSVKGNDYAVDAICRANEALNGLYLEARKTDSMLAAAVDRLDIEDDTV